MGFIYPGVVEVLNFDSLDLLYLAGGGCMLVMLPH